MARIINAFCLALCLVVSALGALAQAPGVTPLGKLLPGGAIFVMSADTRGFTRNLAQLQAIPNMQAMLDTADKALGFSLVKDVVPWAGQFAFALLDVKANNPRVLLLLEIHDPAAFQQALPRMQTSLEKLSDLKWTPTSYSGIALRYATPAQGPSVAWGQIGGWLTLGIGEGATRQCIDAWKGKTPTLSENAAWAKAVDQLPAKQQSFFSLNGNALAKSLSEEADTKQALNSATLKGLMLVGSASEAEQSGQFDLLCTIASAEQQQQLKAYKATLTPVDGSAAAQLPVGAFATLLTSNPGALVVLVKQALIGLILDPDTKQGIAETFTQIKQELGMLNTITGPFALAGSWYKEQGFGLSIAGRTPDAAMASKLYTLLTTYAKAAARQTIDVHDGVASLPTETPANRWLPLQWSWTAKDAWLKVATTPAYLSGNTRALATLPEQARGADAVFTADLGFLSALMDAEEANGKDDTMQGIRLMGLDKLQMTGYARIADDGSCWHGVLEMHNANGTTMVGIGAVALAGALAFPVLEKAREKARETQSLNNLRQLALASMIYTQDNDEHLPPLKTPEDVKRVLKDPPDMVYVQPSSNLPYLPNASLAGKSLGACADPENTILFYEQTPNADGARCAAFLDGHVALLSAEEWETAKVKSGIK